MAHPLLYGRRAQRRARQFYGSDFVRQTVGTDNVCERSAVKASHGGKLVVSKKAGQGITVAVACESYTLRFLNV